MKIKKNIYMQTMWGNKAHSHRKLIAAQTPLNSEETFWKIVFNESYVIIDLTNSKKIPANNQIEYGPITKEERREFPQREKSLQYGDMSVTLKDATDSIFLDNSFERMKKIGKALISTYELRKNGQNENKTVTRIDFYDQDCFSYRLLEMFIDMLERDFSRKNFLIHCQSGFKKTGIVAAALIIVEKIKNRDISIDNYFSKIHEIVFDLRQERIGLIHDLHQFELLHRYTKSLLQIHNNTKS